MGAELGRFNPIPGSVGSQGTFGVGNFQALLTHASGLPYAQPTRPE